MIIIIIIIIASPMVKSKINMFGENNQNITRYTLKTVSEYDQEIPQSQTSVSLRKTQKLRMFLEYFDNFPEKMNIDTI